MVAEPETLVMDPEERTMVDARPSACVEEVRRSPRKPAPTGPESWRVLLGRALVVLAFVGMASWVYFERRSVRELRATSRVLAEAKPIVAASADRGARSETPMDVAASARNVLPEPSATPRAAAELIIQNRLDEALRLYRELAAERPEAPVYRDVVRVLERRLACRAPHGGSDAPCGF